MANNNQKFCVLEIVDDRPIKFLIFGDEEWEKKTTSEAFLIEFISKGGEIGTTFDSSVSRPYYFDLTNELKDFDVIFIKDEESSILFDELVEEAINKQADKFAKAHNLSMECASKEDAIKYQSIIEGQLLDEEESFILRTVYKKIVLLRDIAPKEWPYKYQDLDTVLSLVNKTEEDYEEMGKQPFWLMVYKMLNK